MGAFRRRVKRPQQIRQDVAGQRLDAVAIEAGLAGPAPIVLLAVAGHATSIAFWAARMSRSRRAAS